MPARHDRAADDRMRAICGARKRPRESHGTKISNFRYYSIQLDSRFDVRDGRCLHTSSRFSRFSVYLLYWYKRKNTDAATVRRDLTVTSSTSRNGMRWSANASAKSTGTKVQTLTDFSVQKYNAARRRTGACIHAMPAWHQKGVC